MDAASEFKLQTGNLSAQYGATQTAVANFGMKSGSNEFHGTVYEFHRDRALRARSWGENKDNIDKAPYKENSFGGTVGGPIFKDRTHFSSPMKEIAAISSILTLLTVPFQLPQFKQGQFSQLRPLFYRG